MTNLEKTIKIETEGVISSITFRHDGKHLLGGSALGTLTKWGIDGREIGQSMAMCSEVGTVAASKNGQWIVCGISTGSAIVWNGSTQAKVIEVEPTHTDWVLSVDISPDSKIFATGSYDETAVLWDIRTGQKLVGPLKHPAHVCAVRFSPDGERLATATWGDLSIRIFNRYTGELVVRIFNAVHAVRPNPFAWTSDGQRIFASYKGGMKQHSVETAKELSSWSIDPHRVIGSIGLANNGQFVACPIDREITLWDTVTHVMVGSPIRYTGRVKSIAMSPDDILLATGQDDDQITLQNLRDVLPPSYFVMPPIPASERSHPNMNPRSTSPIIPLMHISDLAFESWSCGRLGNAESVFTQEIARSNRDHHALVNRALIRVRARRWKEAFDDAEESIKIQPSVIASIAKSIALVGNGKIADGYRSCDHAFTQSSNRNDIHLLHIIKSIVLCMAEDYEEAISYLNNRVRVMDDKVTHLFVQAQLYILLGRSQHERHEYEYAVQSFQAAQPPTRAFESPHLTMMSLVFGWAFEDLWINAQRGLCEALCAADRPVDAIEVLHRINNYFAEDLRPSQSTMDWTTDFKQRCALTLERNGDAALAVSDHQEATTYYSLALELCPPRQKPNPKTTILKKWVKAKLASNDSWIEALSASVEFKVPRLAIYQVLCDFLAEVPRIPDAIECLRSASKDAKADTVMDAEYHQWVPDFYHRCGDTAMELEQYDVAIDHYSSAAVLQPQNVSTFFKRSKARVATGRWDDALQDANEAVQVDQSSPMGYEMQYTVFYGSKRYDEAIDAFEKMLGSIEQSKDPEISKRRKDYVSPHAIRSTLLDEAYSILNQSPLVLIDVTSGHLHTVAERRENFERDLKFKELVASGMTKEADEGRIRDAVGKYFGYAMLSHVWTRPEEGEEPVFKDLDETKKTVWDLPKTPPCEKLRKFCHEARNMGFKWGWSDTICIDKSKSAVLDQSLRSMYKWYERSGVTLVLLESATHPSKRGDLRDSVWMTRAWTLQELLAPKVIIFYDSEWKRYLEDPNTNHKESSVIMQELADAIELSRETIVEFHPESLKVREKLRLASKRRATLVEDVAYSLIGIFESDVEPRYGHEYAALGRLLDEIVTRSGEVTVLDWAGKSSQYNSCLPDSISVYDQPPFTPPPLGGEAMETSIARLRGLLVPDEIAKFYTEVIQLSNSTFVTRRLSLPSIVFRVDSLVPLHLAQAGENVYTATVRALAGGTVTFKTAEILSPLEAPRKLVLVYPWIQHIRGPHRRLTQEHEGGMDVASPPPVPYDERTALQLIARFEQPFRALLLLRQSNTNNLYKRVAAEHKFLVEPSITSLKDVRVDTLHIL